MSEEYGTCEKCGKVGKGTWMRKDEGGFFFKKRFYCDDCLVLESVKQREHSRDQAIDFLKYGCIIGIIIIIIIVIVVVLSL